MGPIWVHCPAASSPGDGSASSPRGASAGAPAARSGAAAAVRSVSVIDGRRRRRQAERAAGVYRGGPRRGVAVASIRSWWRRDRASASRKPERRDALGLVRCAAPLPFAADSGRVIPGASGDGDPPQVVDSAARRIAPVRGPLAAPLPPPRQIRPPRWPTMRARRDRRRRHSASARSIASPSVSVRVSSSSVSSQADPSRSRVMISAALSARHERPRVERGSARSLMTAAALSTPPRFLEAASWRRGASHGQRVASAPRAGRALPSQRSVRVLESGASSGA